MLRGFARALWLAIGFTVLAALPLEGAVLVTPADPIQKSQSAAKSQERVRLARSFIESLTGDQLAGAQAPLEHGVDDLVKHFPDDGAPILGLLGTELTVAQTNELLTFIRLFVDTKASLSNAKWFLEIAAVINETTFAWTEDDEAGFLHVRVLNPEATIELDYLEPKSGGSHIHHRVRRPGFVEPELPPMYLTPVVP